jgi:hypothetical protein
MREATLARNAGGFGGGAGGNIRAVVAAKRLSRRP